MVTTCTCYATIIMTFLANCYYIHVYAATCSVNSQWGVHVNGHHLYVLRHDHLDSLLTTVAHVQCHQM